LPPKFKNYFQDFKKLLQPFAKNVAITPQGAGILHYTITQNPQLKNTSGNILTIDIGFNTVDYLITTFDDNGNYKYIHFDSIIDIGVNKCSEVFLSLIEKQNRIINIRPQEAQKILEGNGSYFFAGASYDFSKEKETAINEFSEMLGDLLSYSIPQNTLKSISVVIAGGGGVYYINRDFFPFNFIAPDKPEFAQVLGYYDLI